VTSQNRPGRLSSLLSSLETIREQAVLSQKLAKNDEHFLMVKSPDEDGNGPDSTLNPLLLNSQNNFERPQDALQDGTVQAITRSNSMPVTSNTGVNSEEVTPRSHAVQPKTGGGGGGKRVQLPSIGSTSGFHEAYSSTNAPHRIYRSMPTHTDTMQPQFASRAGETATTRYGQPSIAVSSGFH